MIITADHIRRFPFAVAPHRITDDLQILIAQDMERSARAEGHRKAMPPVNNYDPREMDEEELYRKREVLILKSVMCGHDTPGHIAWRTNLPRHVSDKIIQGLIARGDLAQGSERRHRAVCVTYTLTPAGKAQAEQIIRAEALARSV